MFGIYLWEDYMNWNVLPVAFSNGAFFIFYKSTYTFQDINI